MLTKEQINAPPMRLYVGLRAKLSRLEVGKPLTLVVTGSTSNIYREARRLRIGVRTKILKRYPDGKLKVSIWRVK